MVERGHGLVPSTIAVGGPKTLEVNTDIYDVTFADSEFMRHKRRDNKMSYRDHLSNREHVHNLSSIFTWYLVS